MNNEAMKDIAKEIAKKKFQKWLIGILISSLPFLLGIFVVFIAGFSVLGLFDGDGSSSGGSSSGIVYESEFNYEETTVTVMDGDNLNPLATVSLEDYVLGVVCPEIGACGGNVGNPDSPDYVKEHYIKTKIVVAKTYALARGRYNNTSKSITIKASTRDQQWCDLENGCIVTLTDDLIPGTSEHYLNTYSGNYNGEIDGEITQRYNYTEEDLVKLRQYYSETYGELYLSNSHNDKITSLNHNDEPEYKASTQNYWKQEAEAGKTYIEILNNTASSGVADSEDYQDKTIYKLEDYVEIKYINNIGTLVELKEYPDVGSTKKINKPINQLLSPQEIENLNNYINSSVDKARYGTGEAVAAAGQSLIYGLYQYGYHLPYWYGGGHAKGITLGVDYNWGKIGSVFDNYWYINWNKERNRNTYSYDCSGFVSWAVKNACKPNFSPLTGNSYLNFGSLINFKDAKPGDMMVLKDKHIMLVVKNNGKDGLIVAESTPNKITFTHFKSAEKYVVVDMSNWYKNNCSSSRPKTDNL